MTSPSSAKFARSCSRTPHSCSRSLRSSDRATPKSSRYVCSADDRNYPGAHCFPHTQLIDRNQAEFVAYLQEGTEGDDGDMGELMDQFGDAGGAGGEAPDGSQYVQVTEEEKAAIERLVAMGFERNTVIQAFLACDRDEEMAAN